MKNKLGSHIYLTVYIFACFIRLENLVNQNSPFIIIYSNTKLGIKKKVLPEKKIDNDVLCCAQSISTTTIRSKVSASGFMI